MSVTPYQFALRRRMMMQTKALTLGDLPESTYGNETIVRVAEDQVLKDYLVLKHNYENSGGTLLLRKNLHSQRTWSTTSNAYAVSNIDGWLNMNFHSLFNMVVNNCIFDVDIRYTVGNGNATVSTLTRKVFLLSATEVGLSGSVINVEGSPVPYFSSSDSRIATTAGSSTGAIWWTRSPRINRTDQAIFVGETGGLGYVSVGSQYIRPAIVLFAGTKINADMTLSL